jgi:predicted DNA-binding transcriptional regulator YafY
MKINRLLAITISLLNKTSVTAAELAERFEVSTRTIYRDIEVLSGAGVPVYTNKGHGGGISLLEEYTLNKALISEKESQSLLLALKALEATKYPDMGVISEKIGAIFKNRVAEDWIQIDFSCWGSQPNEDNRFTDIKKAILQHNVICFEYVNSAGNKTTREVEPEKLIYKGYAWYLVGYCCLRGEFRLFRISRIKNVQISSKFFTPRNNVDKKVEDSTGSSKNVVELKLRFRKEALYRLYDDFDQEKIKSNSDGTFDVTMTFPEDEWVYGYILGFGCYVEVLEPDRIRQIIRNKLQKTLNYYQ